MPFNLNKSLWDNLNEDCESGKYYHFISWIGQKFPHIDVATDSVRKAMHTPLKLLTNDSKKLLRHAVRVPADEMDSVFCFFHNKAKLGYAYYIGQIESALLNTGAAPLRKIRTSGSW